MSPKPAFRSDDGVLTSKVARVDEQVTGIGGLNIKDVDFAKHNIKNQDLTNQQRKKSCVHQRKSGFGDVRANLSNPKKTYIGLFKTQVDPFRNGKGRNTIKPHGKSTTANRNEWLMHVDAC